MIGRINERARLLPSRTTLTLGRSLALPLDRCLLLECDSLCGFLYEEQLMSFRVLRSC